MRGDRVVLFFPRTGWDEPEATILPLSLLTLAIPLRRAGFQPVLIDMRVHADWGARLTRELAGSDVVCVGISSMTGPQIGHGLEATRLVKHLSPRMPVVWGGVHPSLLPEQTLGEPLIGAVAIGEGDASLPALARAFAEGSSLGEVPGVAYRDEFAHVVRTAPAPRTPLDELADPDYDLADLGRYRPTLFGSPAGSLPVLTSRGCPYRCAYCYNLSFDARRWRAMGSRRTVEMLVALSRRYAVCDFFLLDDSFFVDPNRARSICEGLLAANANLSLHNANGRVDQVLAWDRSFLELLRRAGIRRLFIGAESGSDEVLRRMEKGHTALSILQANRKLKDAGIEPSFSFMAGTPYESSTDLRATLRLMGRLLHENPSAWILPLALYSPFPGTPLLEAAVQAGFRPPSSLEGWQEVSYDRSSLPGAGPRLARLLERAHYLSTLTDPKVVSRSGRRMGLARRAYARIASIRLVRGWLRFAPELWLREKLRATG